MDSEDARPFCESHSTARSCGRCRGSRSGRTGCRCARTSNTSSSPCSPQVRSRPGQACMAVHNRGAALAGLRLHVHDADPLDELSALQ